MKRVLSRPMFRIGGSAGTGITSGLDQPRKQYENGNRVTQGLDPFVRDVKATYARMGAMPTQSPLAAGTLPGFFNTVWFKFSITNSRWKHISNSRDGGSRTI